MKILSITTSSSICSVCILDNTKVIKELTLNNAKTHSENLMPLISSIFNETNLSLDDIDYIACDVGPGSFTGIRIGIATVKALAEVKSLKIIPVSSLEALAYNATEKCNYICSLIDARNDNVYCGLFNSNFDKITEFSADHIDNIINNLPKENILFIGDGAILQKEKLKNSFSNLAHFETNNSLSSTNLGLCAYKKCLSNITETPDSLVPLYLRKSQAERMLNKNE